MAGSSGILSNLIVNLVANIEGFQGGMNSAADSLQKAGAKMSDIGKAWTQNVTAPLLAGAAVIFKVANDFQDQLGEMAAATGIAEDAANKYGDALLKMAPEVGKGPTELIGSLKEIIKAGFEGAGALSILEKAGKASAAGIGDLDSNISTLITGMKGFGARTYEASNAMDILVAASQEGRVSVSEVGVVLGKISPLAARLGLDMEDAAASIALFSQNTGSSAIAGKQLMALMKEIDNPSKKMVEALEAAGTSIGAIRDSIKNQGLDRAMDDLSVGLEKAGLGFNDVFKSASAADAALQITNATVKDGATVFTRMHDAFGALNKAFATAGGPDLLERTMALLQVGLIKLGEVVVPLVNKAIDALNEKLKGAIKWWDGLSEGAKKNAVYFAGLLAAAGPLLIVFGGMVTALGWIVGAFGTFLGWIAYGLTALKSFGALFGLLRVALLAITGPVGIVVTAIAGLVYYFWDEIPKAIEETLKWFKSLGTGIGPALSKAWKTVSEGFSSLWKTVKQFGANVIKDIPSAFSKAFKAAGKAFSEFWSYLKSIDFGAVGEGIIGGLKAALGGLAGLLAEGIKGAVALLADVFAGVVTTIKDLFSGFFDWTTSTIGELWSKLKSWFTGESSSSSTAVTADMAPVVDLLTQILAALQNLRVTVQDGSSSEVSTTTRTNEDGHTVVFASAQFAEWGEAMRAYTEQLEAQGFTVRHTSIDSGWMVSGQKSVYNEPEGEGCECAPWLERIITATSSTSSGVGMVGQAIEYATSVLTYMSQAMDSGLKSVAEKATQSMAVLEGIRAAMATGEPSAEMKPLFDALSAAAVTAITDVGTKIGETTAAIQAMAADIAEINDHFTGTTETVIPVDGALTQAVTQTITFNLDSRVIAESIVQHFPDVLTLNGA